MPMPRERPGIGARSVPASRITFGFTCRKPAIARSTVVLPQPLGPRSAAISPGATSKDTSSTAGTPP